MTTAPSDLFAREVATLVTENPETPILVRYQDRDAGIVLHEAAYSRLVADALSHRRTLCGGRTDPEISDEAFTRMLAER